MNLREIKALSPGEARHILWPAMFYGKAWGGTLGHYWLTRRKTLCGKELSANIDGFAWRGHCAGCKQRHQALRQRAEGAPHGTT